MVKNTEEYGNEYMNSDDLLDNREYKTVSYKISEYHPPNTLKTAAKELIKHPAISFEGYRKKLVLCSATNASILHNVTGQSDPNKWVGCKVTLQARVVDAFGEECVAIRIIPPAGVRIRKPVLKRLGTKAVWCGAKPEVTQKESAVPAEERAAMIEAMKQQLESAESSESLTAMGGAVNQMFLMIKATKEEKDAVLAVGRLKRESLAAKGADEATVPS